MRQTSTRSGALSRSGTNLALASLFVGMFVLGSGELLVVGLLHLIAVDLQVSIPAAGVLVTAYALGLAAGGPVLTALTIKVNKRTILIGAIALVVVLTLIPVLTGSFGLFVAVRAAIGALHGLFVAVGFVLAMSIVPPERMGRAISVVVSGLFVSTALGVPLGTLVGQLLGWRGSFTAVAVLGVVALVATLMLIPSMPSSGGGAASQARYAFAPRVLAALVVNVVAFAAVFSALTYIVPFLQDVTGISGALISLFLLAYGAATATGSFAGGRFADQDAARTLIVGAIGVAASLLVLYLAGSIAVLVALALLTFGLFAMGMVPSMQYRVVSLAGPGGQLASSLPASAANVGIAFGAYAGGVAIGAFTASAAVITGLVIAVVAIPIAWAASFLKPPTTATALTSDPA
ncbi:major facilitator superfamily MFS_1 [Kribbella flavida DSM 17836]|uniref:Major facilitator superfamily MFS_1 n=1 Tax=Kribbella flavida (strain DSM 17836 / JCM 10339 / NBRC 14399) TaxID=479435 RepID=D2PUI3_KRIFD|nr:MFS transporter [Kribbella flavida]ADB29501.1 major facilitator superfamily MFS_1 [Kribbella flavida DSM 17836]